MENVGKYSIHGAYGYVFSLSDFFLGAIIGEIYVPPLRQGSLHDQPKQCTVQGKSIKLTAKMYSSSDTCSMGHLIGPVGLQLNKLSIHRTLLPGEEPYFWDTVYAKNILQTVPVKDEQSKHGYSFGIKAPLHLKNKYFEPKKTWRFVGYFFSFSNGAFLGFHVSFPGS